MVSPKLLTAKSSDVRDVLINGELLVRDGKLTRVDLPEIMAKGRELAVRVRKSIG